MFKKAKRIISIVVSVSLISVNTAYAWNPKDDFLGNVTGSGSYNDDFTKSKYLYGGSIVFKFKNNSYSNAPLFSFEEPKISAGCNGISITGGFLQVLGLDGLSEQLRNSSTALVYGILIGLIYSTPAIAQALDQIRQIGNWLQKFNQDACNIGRTIGASLGESLGVKKAFEEVDSGFATLITDGNKKAMEFLGEVEKATPTEVKEVFKDLLKTNNEEQRDNNSQRYSTKFDNLFVKAGLAGLILKDQLIPSSSTASVNIGITKIDGGNSTENFYLVIYKLFGDIGFDAKYVEFITEPATKQLINDLITQGKTENNEALEKSSTESAALVKNANNTVIYPESKLTSSKSPLTVEQKLNVLLYGNEKSSTPSTSLEVNTVNILVGKLKEKHSGKFKEVLSFVGENPEKVNIKWDGLFKLSRDNVDCAVSYVKEETSTCDNFPIMFNKYISYVNTIKDLEIKLSKVHGSSYAKSASEPYKQTLAKYNALKIAEIMVGTFIEEVLSFKRANKTEEKSANEQLEKLESIQKEIDKTIKNTVFYDREVNKAVDDIFEELNQKMITEKLQN
jgi:hypothetical protein